MPYASVSDLPESVRSRLSDAQQKRWRATFNAFYARTKDEAGAHKAANAALRKGRESEMEFRITADIADFSKAADQRLVWGWAYTCEIDGEQVVDYSGDVCDWREMQKCAHDFALSPSIGGEMHKSHAGRVVETIFFSPELKKRLGCEHLPTGWFIGFRVDDDDAWEKVKNRTYRAFSIAGRGTFEDIAA